MKLTTNTEPKPSRIFLKKHLKHSTLPTPRRPRDNNGLSFLWQIVKIGGPCHFGELIVGPPRFLAGGGGAVGPFNFEWFAGEQKVRCTARTVATDLRRGLKVGVRLR